MASADTTKSVFQDAKELPSDGAGAVATSLQPESPDVTAVQTTLNQSNLSSGASDWRGAAANSPAGASLLSQDSCEDSGAAPLHNEAANPPDVHRSGQHFIDAASFPRPVNVFSGDGGSRSSAPMGFSMGARPQSQVSKQTSQFDRPQSVSSSPPLYKSSLLPSAADGRSPETVGAKLGSGSPTKPVDDTADEVTRHLLCARSKIEAVENEFAQIMSELTAYSERLPPKRSSPAAPAASPPPGIARNRRGGGAAPRDFPEHFFVGTPLAPHDDSANLSSSSALGRVQMESLSE